MSIAIQKTLTVTIDEEVFNVEDLSAEVQQLVTYLDDWRQHEADETSSLLKTRAALRDLQNTILAQIQKEKAEAEAAEAEEAAPEEVVAEEV